MKVKRVEAGEPSFSGSRANESRDSSETEKQKLRKQINDLRALISRVEGNLDVTRFGDIDKTTETPLPLVLDHRAAAKVPNTNTLFRNEIYRYSGFYCSKLEKGEYVFEYAQNGAICRNETYSMQIFNKDGKGSLGKWVMPMWIDINQILAETPIDNLANVVPLLKNWKLHIDCYTERKLQFSELKNFVSDSSRCVVDANLSFTLVTLQLFGVHDATKDVYANLAVYLSYKQNETRPWKVTTERDLKQSSAKQEKELKAYTKSLKNHRLPEGFRLMTETEHPIFSWTMKDHDDSLLELNDTSDSNEETILDKVRLDRKKSRKKRRKGRQSTQRSKRQRGKGKAANSEMSVDKENAHSQNLVKSPLESRADEGNSESGTVNRARRTSRNRKIAQRQTTISFPRRSSSRINAGNVTHVEVHEAPDAREKKSRQSDDPKPGKKVEKKSALTKIPRPLVIGVQADDPKPADKAEKKSAFTKIPRPSVIGVQAGRRKIVAKNSRRAVTSTPVSKKITGKVKFAATSDVELSPIVSAAEDNDNH